MLKNEKSKNDEEIIIGSQVGIEDEKNPFVQLYPNSTVNDFNVDVE